MNQKQILEGPAMIVRKSAGHTHIFVTDKSRIEVSYKKERPPRPPRKPRQ